MAANMLIGSKTKQLGFTYIGLLMVMAIAGIGMAGVGIVWHQDAQREREKELLFIGNELRNAIGSYYENGSPKQFPTSLEDLILDKRSLGIKRHLRKLYADPMTYGKPWGLVIQKDQIIGVYSTSEEPIIKQTGFQPPYETFGEAVNYSDWKFIYAPASTPVGGATANTNS